MHSLYICKYLSVNIRIIFLYMNTTTVLTFSDIVAGMLHPHNPLLNVAWYECIPLPLYIYVMFEIVRTVWVLT